MSMPIELPEELITNEQPDLELSEYFVSVRLEHVRHLQKPFQMSIY